jgi:hypothetical protein
MNGIETGIRHLGGVLLLGLSIGCGGKVETMTTGNPVSGAAGNAENINERGSTIGTAGTAQGSANAGGASSMPSAVTGSPTTPGIPPSTNPVDASPSVDPGTGQGGTGTCGETTGAPIVCSAVSGPADPVFKGCTSDSECTLQRYQDDCAHPNVLTAYGVAISKVDAFRQCFPLPKCPTERTTVETRGEDGRNNLDAGPRFAVTCEKRGGCAGVCISSIP